MGLRPEADPPRSVLVVEDDDMVGELLSHGLRSAGMQVQRASCGGDALRSIGQEVPDLVISDIEMPGMDGFELVREIRSSPRTQGLPVILLTSRTHPQDAVHGLQLGADDYLRKPFSVEEVLARVEAKLQRPPVPRERLVHDPQTGVLTGDRFLAELQREVVRAGRTGRAGAVAVVDLGERAAVRHELGPRADDELLRHLVMLAADGASPVDVMGRGEDGVLLLLLPERHPAAAEARLGALAGAVVGGERSVHGEQVLVTPTIGWTSFGPAEADLEPEEVLGRATLARDGAMSQLDLVPVAWTPGMEASAPRRSGRPPGRGTALAERLRTPGQIAATYGLGVLLPFLLYLGLYRLGVDVTTPVYIGLVVAMLVTATAIWLEGFYALDPQRPPAEAGGPPPPASAVIAAYLPNEAGTVVETVEAFLRTDYPDLQVVLAYNTPQPMAVEDALRDIAARDNRFRPYKVEGSTSKAQNVNAALSVLTGRFVGVFDADHHPAPDAFHRAWRWLSSGYDVVQGHCVIRNGDASRVARTVAVEFEAIYAVSHPGRARLHGFGVFGGSNGYWRTDLLRAVRMHGFMLTEDIDSSLRVVEDGGRIANDPALLSLELAPTTLGQLWNQRMRWAQGWFQVSVKHLRRGWRSPNLSLRQKLGMSFLLGWREVYPWVALQILPLLAFMAWRAGGLAQLDWLIAVFVLTTVFTLSVGPAQTLFAYRLAAPEVRRHRRWFVVYLVVASFFYTEWKNIIARVAHLKEAMGERQWKVTPRAAGGPAPDDGS